MCSPNSKWRPIETAPKDGSNILLLIDGYAIEGYWSSGGERWEAISLSSHGCGCCAGKDDPPTGWAPLLDSAETSTLWCCHIIGPDDLHAAPDYDTALRWAVMLNRVLASIDPSPLDDPNMPLCVAQVEPWPRDAASHAAALPAAIESMTPAVSR